MNLPRHLNFSYLPTPIVPLKKHFNHIGKQQVWLKRDDLSGLELSGNKVRKLDFLMQEALEQKATMVITCGGLQSNHCRATAFYAKKIGLKAHLVLRGERPAQITGNLLLNMLTGAEIDFISADAYRNVDIIMRQIAEDSAERCYIIPEGGSNATGVWGYARAFSEILAQSRQTGINFDAIVVATGSGGTHAGLLAGKLLEKSSTEIISVNVCDDAPFFRTKIDRILTDFCSKYNLNLSWQPQQINIIDGFVGAGYGVISKQDATIIKALTQSEGIVLDPVYGAKAFRGFQHYLEQGRIPAENILFIHTGGMFGVFPYGQELLKQ